MESLEAKVLAMIGAIILLLLAALVMLPWRKRLRRPLRGVLVVTGLLALIVVGIFIVAPQFPRRFGLAMTTNTAQTSEAPEFPELKTRVYNAPLPVVFARAAALAAEIPKWAVESQDAESGVIKVVWTSTLRGFKDDITITIRGEGETTQVDAHSASREGKGDIGMNRHHLKTFLEALDEKMK
ncbi:MAG: DUF1499 domain-containing protein [Acidobacteria bacterium]|nr:DUF1499 domain-containing protein [Acidobacteriota bacterium]MCW5970068.1 DUF1499 domain-containing protein [Blastocatellales bacterium]